MVADDLTQTPARFRQGPRHPNASLAIFQNGADSTGDVLLKMVIFPAQKAGGRSDPEGSVRPTEQRQDRSAGQAFVRGRPGLEANAVEFDQSRIGPDPNVAVGRLRDRIGGGFERALWYAPRGVTVLSDSRLGVERSCRLGREGQRDGRCGDRRSDAHDRPSRGASRMFGAIREYWWRPSEMSALTCGWDTVRTVAKQTVVRTRTTRMG